MGQKLTLVVTCTERKSVSASPRHQVRNLAPGSLQRRAVRWSSSVSDATDTLPIGQLYQGEAWSQVSRLREAAGGAGFDPMLVVVSAGLGLRSLDSHAPAYSATFTTGHADSVARDRGEAQAWWRHVSRSPASLDPKKTFAGPTLFVLSESYAHALADDLGDMAHREDILIFGGAAGLPEHQRMPADGAMRKHLGGTLTSLNTRMASAWLERLRTPNLVDATSREEWLDWKEGVREVEHFQRRSIQDSAVRDWIRDARTRDPALSRTRALRLLRDSGIACEQRRFATLFSLVETR